MQAALNPGSLLLGITHVQVQKPGCAPHFISPASSSASRRYPAIPAAFTLLLHLSGGCRGAWTLRVD